MDFVEVLIDGAIEVDRDDVEDALSDALDGVGEVTGAGTSDVGSNLDVEVEPSAERSEVLGRIFEAVEQLGLGDAVRVRPGDSDDWIRPSQWRAQG
jgi:hypothetical protein